MECIQIKVICSWAYGVISRCLSDIQNHFENYPVIINITIIVGNGGIFSLQRLDLTFCRVYGIFYPGKGIKTQGSGNIFRTSLSDLDKI